MTPPAIQYAPSISGDVNGPAGATAGHLAVFADGTGLLLADGGAIPGGSMTYTVAYGNCPVAVGAGAKTTIYTLQNSAKTILLHSFWGTIYGYNSGVDTESVTLGLSWYLGSVGNFATIVFEVPTGTAFEQAVQWFDGVPDTLGYKASGQLIVAELQTKGNDVTIMGGVIYCAVTEV